MSACIRVTGLVIMAGTGGDDGDAGIELMVDPAFEYVINESSRKLESGFLHVEAICFPKPVWQSPAAFLICPSDPDPFYGPLPGIGQHVWMEGRWVLDEGHGAFAELHPLYRWGVLV